MSKGEAPRRHHDPERAEARRCQVLDAAMACFARHGFHAASMAEIAREAGMSTGHIYNYFASKEEIIFGIVDRNVQDKLQQMQDLVATERDVFDALLERVSDAICHNTEAEYASLMLEVAAEAARNPAVGTKLREADLRLAARLDELLQTSEQLATYRQDAAREGRLNMLIALFEGIRMRVLYRPGLDRDALVAPMRRAIHAILAG